MTAPSFGRTGESLAPLAAAALRTPLASAVLPAGALVRALAAPRLAAIVAVTLVGVLPLALAPDLRALQHSSLVGTSAVLLSLVAICTRALDGSYAPGGRFYGDVVARAAAAAGGSGGGAAATALGGGGAWATSALTVGLLASLNTAFMGHIDTPRYYRSLRDATPARFYAVSGVAFGLAALTYGISSCCFVTVSLS